MENVKWATGWYATKKDIHKVMVALDIRERRRWPQAIVHGVNLIIVKHAHFPSHQGFGADRAQKSNLSDLVKHDITQYTSSHTNIDIVRNGLNDWLASSWTVKDTEPQYDRLRVKQSYRSG